MTLGYPISDMALGLKGQMLGLGLTEICHELEIYECFFIVIIIIIIIILFVFLFHPR